MLSAIVLPVALMLFTLLVIDLIGLAGDMLVIRGSLSLAVEDGADLLRAKAYDATAFYEMTDPAMAREITYLVATENFAAHAYDPALLAGAQATGCEHGSGPCIYVEPAEGCGRSEPLTGTTRCGPFVSIRVTVPVRLPLGGSVTRTFYAVSGMRATGTGVGPAPPAGPEPTSTPGRGPVGW